VWNCRVIWFTMLSEHIVPGVVLWGALLGSTLLRLR
jgi:hypothetical protein